MNTTLCVVATDAALTKAQSQRVAIMAQDGFPGQFAPYTLLLTEIQFLFWQQGKFPFLQCRLLILRVLV